MHGLNGPIGLNGPNGHGDCCGWSMEIFRAVNFGARGDTMNLERTGLYGGSPRMKESRRQSCR